MSRTAAADIPALRKLYGSSPVAQVVLEHFARRKNASSQTTVSRLLATLQADGHDVVRSDIRQAFKGLAKAGCGTFVVGRKGHPSRFVWDVSLVDAGRAAVGEIDDVQTVKQAGSSTVTPLDDDGLIEHRYRLRPDIELRIDLPANLSNAEAGRIADFVRTLPFA